MKKTLTVLLIISVVVGMFSISTLAGNDEPSDNTGYIVKLKDDAQASVSLFSDDEATEDHGLIYAETESELQKLLESGMVKYYEPNRTVVLLGTVNDEYYGKQWNLNDISVETSWDAGLLGEGATVAIIDSGINAQHEDFVGVNILDGFNMIDGSDNTNDEFGHGTFVSGIIAAAHNNRVGIAGIADEVNILPIKCFSDTDEASIYDICLGIYKAVDQYDCDVICLSLGTQEDSINLRGAVEYAAGKKVIVVAAVGNEGNSETFYPAAYDCVIGVGSYDSSGLFCSFSQNNDSVFVSAPGSNIYSTYIGTSSSYAAADGTSFSTPHVAALAAIAKSYAPDITVDDFKQLLISSSSDAGIEGYDTEYGFGKINIGSFVAALLSYEPGSSTPGGSDDGSAFDDTAGHWAEDSIKYCVANNIFKGVSDTRFDPDGAITRAMLVTVLYRYDNGALPSGNNAAAGFSDITDSGAWYYNAVCWAASNGIVNGYSDGTVRPNEPITREQLATVLYRYNGSPPEDDAVVLAVFSDYNDASLYAANALAWSYKAGLIGGTGNSMLSPSGLATRAQVASIMMRYANNEQ